MHFFVPPRVKGIHRRTRPACEERKTVVKKPVTLYQCTDMVDSEHKSRARPGDETVENSPTMVPHYTHYPPFSNTLIPFLTSILQEK